jgi:hypothetical protein
MDNIRHGAESVGSRECGIEGCERPLFDPAADEREPHILHRCALHEIASYNAEELREWGEDNAADMVAYAEAQLVQEASP